MAEDIEDPPQEVLALELYQRQLDAISRQIEFLQGVLDEVRRAQSALEAFDDSTAVDVLVPLGASTFARGKLEDRDHVIVGIGAGYATERTRKDAIERLSLRAKEAEQELERAMQGAIQLQQEAARLQADASDSDDQA